MHLDFFLYQALPTCFVHDKSSVNRPNQHLQKRIGFSTFDGLQEAALVQLSYGLPN